MFADFINPQGAEIAERYRREFVPNDRHREPHVIVAVWALCADSDEAARRLSTSHRMAMRLFMGGKLIPIPSVETAEDYLAESGEAEPGFGRKRRRISGTPEAVRRDIESVAAEYAAQEAMIVTITHEHAPRVRSYELIAEAFGLD